MFARLLFVVAMLLASHAVAARAEAPLPPIEDRYCHAVAPVGTEVALPPASAFACDGEPRAYENQRLWLIAPLSARDAGAEGATLLVHQTRFERLTILFAYADGRTLRHQVRAGDFQSHWRVGGQLAFSAPGREAPLVSVALGLDQLARYSLLRTRLLPAGDAARDAALGASLIGGALTLLALSSAYNLLLARASRQRHVVWHSAWVATVLVWGLLWSQLALLLFPGLAGTAAARLCTMLATLAIAFAAACAATCPEAGAVPRWLRRLVVGLGWAVALVGIPVAFGPPLAIDWLGPVLSIAVLGLLAAVTILIGIAWRRGSAEARSFFFAWAIPMAVLAATELVDMGTSLFGGGPQIAVLFASAFQTVWLSVSTTLRLARLRTERDVARAAQSELAELAQRDPLTGLLNRRGFVGRAEAALAEPDEAGGNLVFALLLIDVDHFKAVNDRFGHDAGDGVLQRIGARLDALSGPNIHAARLGGEEFALGASGLARCDLADFAERVRASLGTLALSDLLGEGARVSVSIGVAEARGGSRFPAIYRSADRALYAAKNAGRNRVAFAHPGQAEMLPGNRMKAA
ncbi:diguanylate cyclase [Enterovirga sp. GCM10030262]|uniref:GGDEF domain-containing protein n=1 Tax=Enterovirga sp. GCM10030262 TaxID=3273391 RepID=UPI00360C119E